MLELDRIEIVLENCECYEFPATDLGYFTLSDITTCIGRCAMNMVAKDLYVGTVIMEIFNNHRIQKYDFDANQNIDVFKRINDDKDITQICLHYIDGTEETLFVDWGSAEYTNPNQSSYINTCGWLYLVISKELIVNDVFPSAEYNDDVESLKLRRKLIQGGKADV